MNDLYSSLDQATARSAPEREREIASLVRKAEFNADPFAHEFGIAINPSMTEVKGRVLSAPKLLYGGRVRRRHLMKSFIFYSVIFLDQSNGCTQSGSVGHARQAVPHGHRN